MSGVDLLGYAASASVLITFCMSTMVPLRIVAICSNVLFAAFGALAHIYPVLILHLILLPVNVARLTQLLRLIRNIRLAQLSELSIDNILPFMSHRLLKAGEVLVRTGEQADRMFYLAKGAMRIVEFDKIAEPGSVLGEIGIFARDQKRTATIVCVSDCEVFELSERKAKELYFQNQSFGLAILQLIIARLMENVKLLEGAGEPSAAGGSAAHP